MCSIIGYYGKEIAAPIIVKALKRMEYRGYDSVGVATKSENQIYVKKGIGKVAEVNESLKLSNLPGNIGIGHTRWATHGKVTDENAHPHSSNSGKITIVHNGVIENFTELKENLQKNGFTFKSETDTEVIVNLIQQNLSKYSDVKKSILKTVSQLKGHFAFVVMFDDGTLVAARFHEPLIIGIGKNSYFISSDVLGFIENTDDAIYLDNGNIMIIDSSDLKIFSFDGTKLKKPITKVAKEFADVNKGDYAHFTLKEISEQPDTILKAGEDTLEALENMVDFIKHAKNVYFTGSGTSFNAALLAKNLMSKYAKVKVEPLISSEILSIPESIEPNSILIVLSQSGESADVLEAVNIAKQQTAKILSIVNSSLSSLVQESSLVIRMGCGPEIGVAATKSFTAELAIIYKITEKLCEGCMGIDFNKISEAISKVLTNHSKIQAIAKELKQVSDIYVIGRGVHYPIAMEAALKLKELTYIHAEGIAGGELKHGPLALMDSNVYVIIINPDDSTYTDTITNAHEIKSRGAKIIGVSNKNNEIYDHWIQIPKIDEPMYPIIEIIPIQLLAYYSAIEKDTDPDYPRNLAKSVTVK
ncbi:MAG: glutamine--fructose-6-phosphate transaminase (isomerizing) [Thaumarchaeota archaeon]|nr:glutamine--fructose-6-phosphate transaminase (isomerizing) [Nitrososphaerota archaeon]